MTARARVLQISRTFTTTSAKTTAKMPAPHIKKTGPLPSEEAKWTELRKIEVLYNV